MSGFIPEALVETLVVSEAPEPAAGLPGCQWEVKLVYDNPVDGDLLVENLKKALVKVHADTFGGRATVLTSEEFGDEREAEDEAFGGG